VEREHQGRADQAEGDQAADRPLRAHGDAQQGRQDHQEQEAVLVALLDPADAGAIGAEDLHPRTIARAR
jgi:hypothetical protein